MRKLTRPHFAATGALLTVLGIAVGGCQAGPRSGARPDASPWVAPTPSSATPGRVSAPATPLPAPIPPPDAEAARFFATGLLVRSDDEVILFGDEHAVRSTDGGLTFRRLTAGEDLRLVGMTAGEHALFAVANSGPTWERGRVVKSDDGGTTWTTAFQAERGEMAGLNAIVAEASGRSIFAVGRGILVTSTDGGHRWKRGAGAAARVVLHSIWALSANEAMAVGDNGAIVRTRDGGGHWSTLASGTKEQLFAIWARGPDDIYVGGLGVILHSTNRGVSFEKIGTARGLMVTTIWGSGPNDVFVGTAWKGWGGAILRGSGRGDWNPIGDELRDVVAIGGVEGGHTFYVLLSDDTLFVRRGAAAKLLQLPPITITPSD